jgi:hypothetical protein
MTGAAVNVNQAGDRWRGVCTAGVHRGTHRTLNRERDRRTVIARPPRFAAIAAATLPQGGAIRARGGPSRSSHYPHACGYRRRAAPKGVQFALGAARRAHTRTRSMPPCVARST